MAKHLKSSATNMRHSDTINAHTLWAFMNPEYAEDDIRVERKLEALEDELRETWEPYETSQPTHGYNGHDPFTEAGEFARFPKSGIYFRDMERMDYDYSGSDDEFQDEADYEPQHHFYDGSVYEDYTRSSRQADIDDWYDDYPQYEFPDYEWEAYEASLVCEPDPTESEYLEDRYSLPYTQSLRMAVRERVNGDMESCRWNGPYSRGKRCKPSHRPRAGR